MNQTKHSSSKTEEPVDEKETTKENQNLFGQFEVRHAYCSWSTAEYFLSAQTTPRPVSILNFSVWLYIVIRERETHTHTHDH